MVAVIENLFIRIRQSSVDHRPVWPGFLPVPRGGCPLTASRRRVGVAESDVTPGSGMATWPGASGPVPCEGSCGKIGQQIPELVASSRGQGPPHPLVELPGRQPARLEVLAQVRHDRITVRIGSPHFSRKIILRHGVHRVPAFLSRAIVRGFGVYLMSQTRLIGTIAGYHQ